MVETLKVLTFKIECILVKLDCNFQIFIFGVYYKLKEHVTINVWRGPLFDSLLGGGIGKKQVAI